MGAEKRAKMARGKYSGRPAVPGANVARIAGGRRSSAVRGVTPDLAVIALATLISKRGRDVAELTAKG